jgi:twitching motility protein PilT
VLVSTGRVAERIIQPSLGSLGEVISEGGFYGMQTFDQSISGLYEAGVVDTSAALSSASNPHDLRLALQRTGLMAVS